MADENEDMRNAPNAVRILKSIVATHTSWHACLGIVVVVARAAGVRKNVFTDLAAHVWDMPRTVRMAEAVRKGEFG